MVYEIADDAGLLALVDPAAYQQFPHEDWDFTALQEHLRRQMTRRALLVWGTGEENIWTVDVRIGATQRTGVREVTGIIHVLGNGLCLTNYTALTEGIGMDEPVTGDMIPLAPGSYQCRIVQRRLPDDDAEVTDGADFLLELTPVIQEATPWTAFPWWDE